MQQAPVYRITVRDEIPLFIVATSRVFSLISRQTIERTAAGNTLDRPDLYRARCHDSTKPDTVYRVPIRRALYHPLSPSPLPDISPQLNPFAVFRLLGRCTDKFRKVGKFFPKSGCHSFQNLRLFCAPFRSIHESSLRRRNVVSLWNAWRPSPSCEAPRSSFLRVWILDPLFPLINLPVYTTWRIILPGFLADFLEHVPVSSLELRAHV